MARDDIFKVSGTTAEQRARWREAAGGGARDLSAWIRAAADAASGADTVMAQDEAVSALRGAIVALRADLARGVGNNLNQIARDVNAAAKAGAAAPVGAVELTAAAAAVEEMREALTAALGNLSRTRRR